MSHLWGSASASAVNQNQTNLLVKPNESSALIYPNGCETTQIALSLCIHLISLKVFEVCFTYYWSSNPHISIFTVHAVSYLLVGKGGKKKRMSDDADQILHMRNWVCSHCPLDLSAGSDLSVRVKDPQVKAAVDLSLFTILEQVAPCSRPEVKCSGNRESKRREGEKPSYILFMCFLSTYTLLLSPHTCSQRHKHTNPSTHTHAPYP